jgi:hypothetical protein
MCGHAVASCRSGGSCELAPRHRCHLPTSEEEGRPEGHCLARGRAESLLHQRRLHRAVGVLGSNKGREATAGVTGVADAAGGRPHGRIHGFNGSAAHVWAEQERLLEKARQRMPVEDSYFAATARRHGLTVATGNDRGLQAPRTRGLQPVQGTAIGALGEPFHSLVVRDVLLWR